MDVRRSYYQLVRFLLSAIPSYSYITGRSFSNHTHHHVEEPVEGDICTVLLRLLLQKVASALDGG